MPGVATGAALLVMTPGRSSDHDHARVNEAAHDVGGGRLVASVTDPDGNVLGLIQDR